MAVSLAPHDDEEASEDAVLSAINTTPLVDVMLVLLIIFLITIPVVTRSVPVSLPRETARPSQSRPDAVVIAVDAAGTVYWNEGRVAGADDLADRLNAAAASEPQPEIQLRGDQDSRFEAIGQVMLACQRAGIAKLGFITEPAEQGP